MNLVQIINEIVALRVGGGGPVRVSDEYSFLERELAISFIFSLLTVRI
jgi:hypothetical protein